jgi:hypothetical protein
MPSFDPMEFVLDSDDGLGSAMGTDILAAHDLAPEEQEDTLNQPFRSQGLPVRLIHGKRYLEVDQTANQRHQSKISKISLLAQPV